MNLPAGLTKIIPIIMIILIMIRSAEEGAMARQAEVETVNLRVSGPGRYKVLAGLAGSDTVTRVALADKDAKVTVEGGARPFHLGGRDGAASDKAAVLYMVAGDRKTVQRFDDVMRHVEALLETAGPEKVMEMLLDSQVKGRRDPVASAPPAPVTAASADMARRWAERKAAMLRDNDHATGPELGRLVGSRARNSAERASSWRRSGRIFAVSDGSRDVYPLFQIKADKPHPVVADLLVVLRRRLSDWEIFAWFTAPDIWSCEGRPPKDLLDSAPEAALEAARHATAEHWD